MPDLKPQPKKSPNRQILTPKPYWQTSLSEYITAIAWSGDGKLLAAATANGEVVLKVIRSEETQSHQLIKLQAATDLSADCLEFSADGRWLAVAGQGGRVNLWDLPQSLEADRTNSDVAPAIALDMGDVWIDKLVWHPQRSEFAFSLDKYVQVWSAETRDIVTTVDFDNSAVLALNWHPSGDWLTVGGYQGIKLWRTDDWDADPIVFALPTATALMAWDVAGKLLVANTIDKTVLLLQWLGSDFDNSPWRMQGFPGKIRSFAWLAPASGQVSSLLVTASGAEVVVWRHHPDPSIGWEGKVLQGHTGTITQATFQPGTAILATAGTDGRVSLWQDAQNWIQALENSQVEISCLQWQPQGRQLAAGNADGELLVWTESTQAAGFGQPQAKSQIKSQVKSKSKR